MLFLWRLTARRNGWGFWSAPKWFYEGAEEYFSLTCSTEHARTETKRLYIEDWRKRWMPGYVPSTDERIVYSDGAALLTFMNEQFGPDQMFALLRDTDPSFIDAFFRAFRMNTNAFVDRCRIWIESLP